MVDTHHTQLPSNRQAGNINHAQSFQTEELQIADSINLVGCCSLLLFIGPSHKGVVKLLLVSDVGTFISMVLGQSAIPCLIKHYSDGAAGKHSQI